MATIIDTRVVVHRVGSKASINKFETKLAEELEAVMDEFDVAFTDIQIQFSATPHALAALLIWRRRI